MLDNRGSPRLGWIVVAAALSVSVAGASGAHAPATTHLVIVVDGLRPDYITPDLMPRLSRLGQRGIVFSAHHAVYPTVTRVNASSLVTGAYPETHGLLGNTIYIPSADPTRGLDTGDRANLERVAQAEGQLLTAPSLSEILGPADKRLLAVSSGSSGSALLLNAAASGSGSTIHTEFVRPPELAERVNGVLGPPPAKAMPNDAQNRFAIDAYLAVGLVDVRPEVTFMWINDPDGTAHATGMGSEMTRRALGLVDAGIGRIEDTLASKGLLDRTNLLVTSDHGFSTHTGEFNLARLVAPFARTMPDGSSDIVVAEGAVYLRSRDADARVVAIVAALQQRPEVGAIFTRARTRGSSEGVVPGTLSFDTARWNHARAGVILVSANWTHGVNSAGLKGTTAQGGVAGHGTSSPYDIHSPLIAAGPDFRAGTTSDVPTANVDIAPTLLHLLGVPVPSTMTGRVIREGLRTGPSPSTLRVTRSRETVRSTDGRYRLSAVISTVAGHRYLDYTEVIRR